MPFQIQEGGATAGAAGGRIARLPVASYPAPALAAAAAWRAW